jgi:hypothetical protein
MKIIRKIKAFFSRINQWFVRLLNENDKFVLDVAPVAIAAINILKRANEEGIINISGCIISNIGAAWGIPVSKQVSAWLTNNVDYMLSALDLAEKAARCTTLDEKLKMVSEAISKDFPEMREQFCTSFCADLARYLADGHLSFAEAIALITAVYKTQRVNENSSAR